MISERFTHKFGKMYMNVINSHRLSTITHTSNSYYTYMMGNIFITYLKSEPKFYLWIIQPMGKSYSMTHCHT
jgi:hypothetical protein